MQTSYSVPLGPKAVRFVFRAWRNFGVDDAQVAERMQQHSEETFEQDLERGAWGIMRVHDTDQADLQNLPNGPAPAAGAAR